MITAITIIIGSLAWFGILVICGDLLKDASPATSVAIGAILGSVSTGLLLALKSM